MYDLETNNDDELENDGQDNVVDYPENDEVEVDDVVDSDTEDFEGEEVEDEIDDNGEVIAPEESTKQSPAENAQFKKMRLKAEKEAETKYSSQRAELETMKQDIQQQRQEQEIRNNILTPDKIYEYADKEGISEEIAAKILNHEADNQINANKIKIAENFNKVQVQKKELSKSKYFKLLENDVDNILLQHPDAEFKDVYKHMLGDRIDELEQKLSSSIERQTVANIHARSKRRNLGGSAGGSDDAVNPSRIVSEKGLEMANIFGTDPRALAKYVKDNTKKKGR